MLTQHEAQLYLAEKLPERIEYVPFAMEGDIEHEPYFAWKEGSLDPILETEWQQISLWVEEKIPYSKWMTYVDKLEELIIDQSPTKDYRVISANYITRATAMKETGS
jgi:hypothetical protein